MKLNSTDIGIIAAAIIVLLMIWAAVAVAVESVSIDEFIRNVSRYIDHPEPPPEHPRRNKQMHERLHALRIIVQQLDEDVVAGSHPITIRNDAVQVAGHAFWLAEVYALSWESDR